MLLGNHMLYDLGLCVLGYLIPGWFNTHQRGAA